MVKALGNYKEPVAIEVEGDKTYWFCECGKSSKQPWCDGSHSGTDFVPSEWTAPKSGQMYFCQCKLSGKTPLCDGTHAKIDE